MSTVREAPAARPFVVAAGDGEHIWFTNTSMTIKATAASTGRDLFLMEAVVPSGFSPPLHVHHDEHEGFYLLEGALEVMCGGERHHAAAGDFAFLPRGIAHTFRVVSERPARILNITVPGGAEGFFREVGRPAERPGLPPAGPIDVARLKEVAARFNNEIIGPPLGPS